MLYNHDFLIHDSIRNIMMTRTFLRRSYNC